MKRWTLKKHNSGLYFALIKESKCAHAHTHFLCPSLTHAQRHTQRKNIDKELEIGDENEFQHKNGQKLRDNRFVFDPR